MRRTWCILTLLVSAPCLFVSLFTVHQELAAQPIPAPMRLSITESVVSQPPPPQREEMIPLAPLLSSVWVPGYWAWNSGWQWVAGHWAQPPQGRTTWVPGQWMPQDQSWVWRPGRWQ